MDYERVIIHKTGDFMMDTRKLEVLREKVKPIAEKYGLAALYLFGSRARGDNRSDSDYDFYVKKGHLKNFFQLGGLMIALEKSLGTEVDIVTVDFNELDDYLKEAILKDGILVYGQISEVVQIRTNIRFSKEITWQEIADIFKNKIKYDPKKHQIYFLGFFEECHSGLIKKIMAEQHITRNQILNIFNLLPKECGETFDFRKALNDGQF